MNARLRTAKDGSTQKFLTARVAIDGKPSRPMIQIGRVYWPFAVREVDVRRFTIIHLPSGYTVVEHVPMATALALIRALRATSVDPTFTKPQGRKWKKASAAWKPLVVPVRKRYSISG